MSEKETLERLLALERAYDDLPPGAEGRILDRVAATIAGGPGGDGGGDGGTNGGNGAARTEAPPATGGHTAGAANAVARWVAPLAYGAVGVVVGASGHALVTSTSSPASAPAASISVVASAPQPVSSTAVRAEPSAERSVAAPPSARPDRSAAPPEVRAASSAPRADKISEERAALDVARAALARGRYDACLAGLEAHARTFGAGEFAEEREALFVQALAAAGRRDEAEARAERFFKKYPTSLFGPAIRQAIAEPR